jgi:hypothetical protein
MASQNGARVQGKQLEDAGGGIGASRHVGSAGMRGRERGRRDRATPNRENWSLSKWIAAGHNCTRHPRGLHPISPSEGRCYPRALCALRLPRGCDSLQISVSVQLSVFPFPRRSSVCPSASYSRRVPVDCLSRMRCEHAIPQPYLFFPFILLRFLAFSGHVYSLFVALHVTLLIRSSLPMPSALFGFR